MVMTKSKNWETEEKKRQAKMKKEKLKQDGFSFKKARQEKKVKEKPFKDMRDDQIIEFIKKHPDWTDQQVADHFYVFKNVVENVRKNKLQGVR